MLTAISDGMVGLLKEFSGTILLDKQGAFRGAYGGMARHLGFDSFDTASRRAISPPGSAKTAPTSCTRVVAVMP